ncbi:hypothetical protein ACFOZY_03175 [Chungangia koreensis]|uniref:Uncharacterized protein n=1 Tax=Chungangia koreensis TaxID=752657 RepID=A0ABV8X387_9LACT
MGRKKGIAVLLAEPYKARNGTFHMKAWCPNCVRYHDHGGMDQGHVVAHCLEGAYKATGYYLKIDMDKPENVELLKQYKASKN